MSSGRGTTTADMYALSAAASSADSTLALNFFNAAAAAAYSTQNPSATNLIGNLTTPASSSTTQQQRLNSTLDSIGSELVGEIPMHVQNSEITKQNAKLITA